MTQFKQSPKTRINRLPKRGHYDKETIYKILDEALICHVGFVENGQPHVIPINFARVDDIIILHGAKASRLLKHVEAGHPVCVEVTIVDGLVLARSIFHHSINYRSVVLFGTGYAIEDVAEKMEALRTVADHIIPGRWDGARLPNEKELNATRVVGIKIDEASARCVWGRRSMKMKITTCRYGQVYCRCWRHPSPPFRMKFNRTIFRCQGMWLGIRAKGSGDFSRALKMNDCCNLTYHIVASSGVAP